jgi:hypothetical protein
VFVSLLSAWTLGMIINVIAYKAGRWKKRQVNRIEAELAQENAALATE